MVSVKLLILALLGCCALCKAGRYDEGRFDVARHHSTHDRDTTYDDYSERHATARNGRQVLRESEPSRNFHGRWDEEDDWGKGKRARREERERERGNRQTNGRQTGTKDELIFYDSKGILSGKDGDGDTFADVLQRFDEQNTNADEKTDYGTPAEFKRGYVHDDGESRNVYEGKLERLKDVDFNGNHHARSSYDGNRGKSKDGNRDDDDGYDLSPEDLLDVGTNMDEKNNEGEINDDANVDRENDEAYERFEHGEADSDVNHRDENGGGKYDEVFGRMGVRSYDDKFDHFDEKDAKAACEGKPDEKKADEKKADEKKADEKKADEKKADEKKADEKKADEKKADEKKADEKKADEKKADEKKADEKKADAKKVNEKKVNEKKARKPAKAEDKKPKTGVKSSASDCSKSVKADSKNDNNQADKPDKNKPVDECNKDKNKHVDECNRDKNKQNKHVDECNRDKNKQNGKHAGECNGGRPQQHAKPDRNSQCGNANGNRVASRCKAAAMKNARVRERQRARERQQRERDRQRMSKCRHHASTCSESKASQPAAGEACGTVKCMGCFYRKFTWLWYASITMMFIYIVYRDCTQRQEAPKSCCCSSCQSDEDSVR